MTEVPSPRPSGRSWALWERLAQGRIDFGNPDVFFGTARIPDSLWVTFTVTDTGPANASVANAATFWSCSPAPRPGCSMADLMGTRRDSPREDEDGGMVGGSAWPEIRHVHRR
jgi:hypothetical protein